MSIVAPMSPTTQRCKHSRFRRRKSMSLVASKNIKVIYLRRINLRHRMSFCRLSDIGREIRDTSGEAVLPLQDVAKQVHDLGEASRVLRSAEFRRSMRSAANFHPASAESR